jgi:murein DD-endopeptidase MepM/ murein hydrolase activator NlpD
MGVPIAGSRRAGGALLALLALTAAHSAHANSAPEMNVTPPVEAALPPGPEKLEAAEQSPRLLKTASGAVVRIEASSGRVSVSRAADILGRPTYAWRSVTSGSGSQVLLSFRRPPPSGSLPTILSGATASLPTGMPLSSATLTSGFGMRRHPVLGGRRAHSGIDLAAPAGTPIFATSPGTVAIADRSGGYGLMVALEHGGGVETRYAHMSRIAVASGQQVRKGDVIGYVGSTGRSTGPHLHYEMRVNGRAMNPASAMALGNRALSR